MGASRPDLENIHPRAYDLPVCGAQGRMKHAVHVGAYLRRAEQLRQVVFDAELEGTADKGQGLADDVGCVALVHVAQNLLTGRDGTSDRGLDRG